MKRFHSAPNPVSSVMLGLTGSALSTTRANSSDAAILVARCGPEHYR